MVSLIRFRAVSEMSQFVMVVKHGIQQFSEVLKKW